MKVQSKTQMLATNALIGAIYILATTMLAPISYGAVQFRMAEVLMLLPFYNKNYSYGIAIGCLVANMFSPLGIIDVVVGTGSSILVLWLYTKVKSIWSAVAITTLSCSIFVGSTLYFVLGVPPLFAYVYVGFGELVVLLIGVALFKTLMKNKTVRRLIIDGKK